MKALKILLAAIAILGYAALVTYCIVATVQAKAEEPELSETLIYIVNGLCGLIGGIVAAAFGVELPRQISEGRSRYSRKMNALGNFLVIWKLAANGNGSGLKKLLGTIYAWVYFVAGVAAIVLWAADDAPHVIIKNIATVSFGLLIIVVKNFFDES